MNGTPEAETGTVENSLRFVDNGDDYFMFAGLGDGYIGLGLRIRTGSTLILLVMCDLITICNMLENWHTYDYPLQSNYPNKIS